jgi:hypothetical protein
VAEGFGGAVWSNAVAVAVAVNASDPTASAEGASGSFSSTFLQGVE